MLPQPTRFKQLAQLCRKEDPKPSTGRITHRQLLSALGAVGVLETDPPNRLLLVMGPILGIEIGIGEIDYRKFLRLAQTIRLPDDDTETFRNTFTKTTVLLRPEQLESKQTHFADV